MSPPVVCTLVEGFENIETLVGNGWVTTNNSQPLGTTEWFQGDSNFGWLQANEVFPAQSGSARSYIAANFLSGNGSSTISDWLLTPPLTLQNGGKFSFWTRTGAAPLFPDHLEVRMSTNGSSQNVGTTATSVGDFATLLIDINPTYTTSGYPLAWTNSVVTLSGLDGTVTGRLALRYFVENGGPSGINSDYVGLDNLAYDCNGNLPGPPSTPTPGPPPTPTPGTPVAFVLGTVFYCSTPMSNVRINTTGTVTGSTLSDGTGNYQVRFLPWAGFYTIAPAKPARTPGSLGISTTDVVAIQRHFLAIGPPLSGCRLVAADVNGDNLVSTVDALAVQRFFFNLSTGIANVGKYQFSPATRSYTGDGANHPNQNYDVVVLGDVAAPFVVP
jgi:hypothetical protein